MPLPPQPVPGGLISATMRDLDGCFNLNNLAPQTPASADWLRIFQALLSNRGVNPPLATAVQAWLDAGPRRRRRRSQSLPRPAGAVPAAPAARSRTCPNCASCAAWTATSTRDSRRTSARLPPGTRLNVNTASVPVLQALGIDARPCRNASGRTGTRTTPASDEFIGDAREPALAARQALLGTRSSWFLARGDIVLDGVPFTFYSLIGRMQGSGIRVLERSRGSDDALLAAPRGGLPGGDGASG